MIFFFLFFFNINLIAKEFYISFFDVSENNIIINQTLEYSQVMTKPNLNTIKTFMIPAKYNNLKDIFEYQQNDIIDLLSKNRIYLYSYTQVTKNSFYDRIKISYPPKRFDIFLKDGYVYFLLKGDK